MTTHPNRIGKFEIMDPLGEGALGALFLARDTIIGREVALRTLHADVAGTPESRERFLREAQAASRLAHPNLASTHEVGEDAGMMFMTMEYVGGESLSGALREQRLTPQETLELLAQVCDGLAYAHGKGVFHRALTPSSIRITRVSGRPTAKILDFGISRPSGAITAGDLGYQAPEQGRSGKPDGKPDLFAMGVILYEALTGIRPFEGETPAACLQRLQNEEPAPLDLEKLSSISPAIQGILDHLLAKDPARRFASASALAAALRAARNPAWTPQSDAPQVGRSAKSLLAPGLMPPPPSSGPGAGRILLRIFLGLLITAAILAAGAGGYLGYRRYRRHHPRPAHPPVPAPVTLPAPPQPLPPAALPQPEAQQPAAPQAQPAPQAPTAAPQPAQTQPQAQTQAQAQAPRPAEGKSRFKSLDEADAALGRTPQEALAYLEEAVAANPADERALALRMVALYTLGRYGACAKAMGEAKAAGHPILNLSQKYPRFKKMLEVERQDPRMARKPKPAPAAASPAN